MTGTVCREGITRAVCVTLLCLAGLAAASCGKQDKGGAKELNVYTFAAYVPPDLVKRFEQKYGVKVNVHEYSSNEEMLAELDKNPGAYDVIAPSDYAVEILRRDRQLEPLDLAKIDNFKKNIDRRFQNPYFDPGTVSGRKPYKEINTAQGKFSVPYQYGTTGIAYDSTKVKLPIKSWQDLFRPEFEGKIVLLNDSREVLGAALVALGYPKNDTNRAHLEQAKQLVERLKPRVVRFDSDFPERALLDGEAVAGMLYNGNAATAQAKNPKIRYVLPDRGGGIWFDNLAVPKDAPNKDAAQKFLNFVLEPDEGADITRTYRYSSPNKKAREVIEREDPAFLENPIVNPSETDLEPLVIIKDVGPASRALYDELWQEATSGSKVVGS